MTMGDFGYSLQIDDIRIRISKGFQLHSLCVILNGFFEVFRITAVHK